MNEICNREQKKMRMVLDIINIEDYLILPSVLREKTIIFSS
jgi:hypothetical protein